MPLSLLVCSYHPTHSQGQNTNCCWDKKFRCPPISPPLPPFSVPSRAPFLNPLSASTQMPPLPWCWDRQPANTLSCSQRENPEYSVSVIWRLAFLVTVKWWNWLKWLKNKSTLAGVRQQWSVAVMCLQLTEKSVSPTSLQKKSLGSLGLSRSLYPQVSPSEERRFYTISACPQCFPLPSTCRLSQFSVTLPASQRLSTRCPPDKCFWLRTRKRLYSQWPLSKTTE